MSEITAAMIEQRNEKYLKELQGNIGKYLSFLSTMARFHKYPVEDLTSFAIEAPAMFTAVASAEFWSKHFRRSISTHAKGVTLIKDGKKTVFYDVSETEAPLNNPMDVRLWQYDDSVHKKFIDVVVSGEADTEKQIHVIAEELANRSSIDKKSKKLLTLSVEAVILERMGLTTENATRQLARISFKEHDVPALLAETQATARIFLDAMQKSVNLQAVENVDIGRKLVRESVVVAENVRESAEGFENDERTLFFKENIFKGENSWVGIVHRLRERKYGKPVSENGLDNAVFVSRDSIIGVKKNLERRGSWIATTVGISF